MRRWYCPRCGDGILAPASAPMRDARRWCLGCTPRNGQLQRRWRASSAADARALEAAEQAIQRRRAETARRNKARAVERDVQSALSGEREVDARPRRRRCHVIAPMVGTQCARVSGHAGPHYDGKGTRWA